MRLLLALALFLALAGTAQASPDYPGMHGLDQPEIHQIVDLGTKFWADRGITVAPPTLLTAKTVGNYADGGMVTPFAGEPRCRAWSPSNGGEAMVVCRDDFVYPHLGQIRNRYLPIYIRRDAFITLCRTYFHEFGHVGGIAMPAWIDGRWHDNHTESGIMSKDMTTPGVCIQTARRKIRFSKTGYQTRFVRAGVVRGGGTDG